MKVTHIDQMAAPIFDTFGPHALEALKARDIPRVRAADYFTPLPDDPDAAQAMERWDSYLAKFARLTDAKCLCCGNSLRCTLGMGISGGFRWGLAHGEGHCRYCNYPMRGYHAVDGVGVVRNLFLPYHPSGLNWIGDR